MSKLKRYAVCGVSSRAINMWIKGLNDNFRKSGEIVALLDIDPLRFKVCYELNPTLPQVPCYMPEQFDRMIDETKPDAVIVTSMDCTHVTYILAGLKHNLDVITEKPMCTNFEDCLRVREAEKNSKGKVICTFNYRYNPVHCQIRELILEGKVGKVTNVDLNWYIDVKHGASYFNRWNRMRENSGSLSIHKSSHHFDLVNWWIDGIPEKVHAFGDLNYYGPDSPLNPSKKDGRHCASCDEKSVCPYYSRWATRNDIIEGRDDALSSFMGIKAARYTDYCPDKCLFDSEINIYDTMVVNVRYRNGALLNYSANFSTPYEGYRLAINGTKGRIEAEEWTKARQNYTLEFEKLNPFVDYYPLFGKRQRTEFPDVVGGHGGGDPLIKEDVFLGPDPNAPFKILANAEDACRAIAIGDAVWHSIKEDKVIQISGL